MEKKIETITEEMINDPKLLAETLNHNFKALEDNAVTRHAELMQDIAMRHNVIMDGLKAMEGRINSSYEKTIDNKLRVNNGKIIKRLDNILRQNGIDPNLLTEYKQ